jgi:hypothetical protein
VFLVTAKLMPQNANIYLSPCNYKTRNGNPLLLELWHQFNGVAPVRGDLSITIRSTTDGASGTNMGEKIDLTGKKRFCVFPNGFECVKVG